MGALILWIGRATGLSSLLSAILAYAFIALLSVGGFWGYGAYKHHQGYVAGSSQERIAWEEQRKRDLAKQAADKAATQAEIDRLVAELQIEAQKRKDEQADADLKKAQDASPSAKKHLRAAQCRSRFEQGGALI